MVFAFLAGAIVFGSGMLIGAAMAVSVINSSRKIND